MKFPTTAQKTKAYLLFSQTPAVCDVYRNVTCQNGNEKELQRISLFPVEDEKYSARDQGLRYFSEKNSSQIFLRIEFCKIFDILKLGARNNCLGSQNSMGTE